MIQPRSKHRIIARTATLHPASVSSSHPSSKSTETIVNIKSNLLQMSRMWIRPVLAFGLSLIYGNYLDNRIFASNKELMRSGIMAGSVLASDIAGNMLMPHLATSKLFGGREVENMVIEPVLSGVFYSAGKYFLVDGALEISNVPYDFAKGAAIDFAAGAGEYGVNNFLF